MLGIEDAGTDDNHGNDNDGDNDVNNDDNSSEDNDDNDSDSVTTTEAFFPPPNKNWMSRERRYGKLVSLGTHSSLPASESLCYSAERK